MSKSQNLGPVSAYALAVSRGFEGTLDEWLALERRYAIDAQRSATQASEAAAQINSRIDEAISGITEDSEVLDIRVGSDGTTYQTAGTAVRTQIGEVKRSIADEFSNTRDWAVGEYALHIDGLYRCVNPVEKGKAWSSNDWVPVSVAGELPNATFINVDSGIKMSYKVIDGHLVVTFVEEEN